MLEKIGKKILSRIGKNLFVTIGVILVLSVVFVIGYLITAGLTYLIFECFNLSWSWKIAFGIYLVILLIRWALSGIFKVSKD